VYAMLCFALLCLEGGGGLCVCLYIDIYIYIDTHTQRRSRGREEETAWGGGGRRVGRREAAALARCLSCGVGGHRQHVRPVQRTAAGMGEEG
jgi:hypothetical protein